MARPAQNERFPLSWYFDPNMISARRELVEGSPHYVGHERMVPGLGDYRVLESRRDGEILVHGDEGFHTISNLCLHQRAKILDPSVRSRVDARSGNLARLPGKRFLCPIHRWGYDAEGALLSAPQFEEKPRHCLRKTALRSWKGYLFANGGGRFADLEGVGYSGAFDPELFSLDGYRFVGTEVVDYPFSWENFIEIYQDLYHVAPYHPKTFAKLVDARPSGLSWELGDGYTVQVADWKEDGDGASPLYERFRALSSRRFSSALPPHGALWMTIYPNTMIEWYPAATIVSTIWPNGSGSRNVVEYYLPGDLEDVGRGFFLREAAKIVEKAYQETAVEDAEICQSIEEGRLLAHAQGEELGPCHPTLELGVSHFHRYLREELFLRSIRHRRDLCGATI